MMTDRDGDRDGDDHEDSDETEWVIDRPKPIPSAPTPTKRPTKYKDTDKDKDTDTDKKRIPMTEALSSLLSDCQSCDPPFELLIETTLSSLSSSRFHFAVQLQQTLDSNRDTLAPVQKLCILYTVYTIGNGFSNDGGGGGDDDGEDDSNHHPFADFLNRYHEIRFKIQNSKRSQMQMQMQSQAHAHAHAHAHAPPPQFHRPAPPLSNISNQSPSVGLHFLHTSYPALRYQWLPPYDPKPGTEELLEKAFRAPLELEEEQIVLSHCNNMGIGAGTTTSARQGMGMGMGMDSSNGKDGNPPLLTPDNLPKLVEHNPTMAIELLMKLADNDESASAAAVYHSALVNMDITIHTMEVVYKLATNHQLNSEYLHVFVLGLFERCAKTEGGHDRKLVRLVSVFLQNLIQNAIVNVEDFVEVQAFCIENSRVREANTLFKLLKEKSSRR